MTGMTDDFLGAMKAVGLTQADVVVCESTRTCQALACLKSSIRTASLNSTIILLLVAASYGCASRPTSPGLRACLLKRQRPPRRHPSHPRHHAFRSPLRLPRRPARQSSPLRLRFHKALHWRFPTAARGATAFAACCPLISRIGTAGPLTCLLLFLCCKFRQQQRIFVPSSP